MISKPFAGIQSDILEGAMVTAWESRQGKEKWELVQMFNFSHEMSHSDDAEQHWTKQKFCSELLNCDLGFRRYH